MILTDNTTSSTPFLTILGDGLAGLSVAYYVRKSERDKKL
jgi:hypothetical protein